MPEKTDQSAAATVATPDEVKAFRAEAGAEWGQYVAVSPISFNGARAFNAGDPVPASNVKAHKYDEQGLVAKVSSKAAQDVVAGILSAAVPSAGNIELPPPVSLGVPVKE